VCSVKRDLHTALIRNGFLMPRLKDRLCTYAFMTEVRLGKCFVPRVQNLQKVLCADKPTEKYIRAELITLIK
jgi:hypothetical protein